MRKSFFVALLFFTSLFVHAELPKEGTWGLDFSVGTSSFVPVKLPTFNSTGVSSLAFSGLGVNWWANDNLSLRGCLGLVQSWLATGAQDTQNIMGADLAFQALFRLAGSGNVRFFAGPAVEAGFVYGQYQTNSTGIINTVTGLTLSAGAVAGAEAFVLPNFSVGASVPFLATVNINSTNSSACAANPFGFSVALPQRVQADMVYYF